MAGRDYVIGCSCIEGDNKVSLQKIDVWELIIEDMRTEIDYKTNLLINNDKLVDAS